MQRLITGFPAIALGLSGVVLAAAGAIYPIGASAIGGMGSGQIQPWMLAFGAGLVLGGVLLVWLAIGVWRGKLWRTHLALVFTIATVVTLVWAAVARLTPALWVYNPAQNRLEPYDDGRTGLLLLVIAFYLAAVACLAFAEFRHRHLRGI